MWDLSSLSRHGTHAPCCGSRSLDPWAAREVLVCIYMYICVELPHLMFQVQLVLLLLQTQNQPFLLITL